MCYISLVFKVHIVLSPQTLTPEILATGFGIMLTGAYIEPIAGNSIEDTQRYIEQYQIILLGMKILIYVKLSLIITTGLRLFYFWIKEKFIRDKIFN